MSEPHREVGTRSIAHAITVTVCGVTLDPVRTELIYGWTRPPVCSNGVLVSVHGARGSGGIRDGRHT
jgi:hypothetical protein